MPIQKKKSGNEIVGELTDRFMVGTFLPKEKNNDSVKKKNRAGLNTEGTTRDRGKMV